VSGRFWKVTAIRSYFIDNFWKTKSKLTWRDIESHTNEKRGLLLLYEKILSSAIVNLSKKVSPPSTPGNRLSTLAEENFDIWFKQLQEYKPHIVICCGTYGAVK
jgi:type I site-specific restriction endonuclease